MKSVHASSDGGRLLQELMQLRAEPRKGSSLGSDIEGGAPLLAAACCIDFCPVTGLLKTEETHL